MEFRMLTILPYPTGPRRQRSGYPESAQSALTHRIGQTLSPAQHQPHRSDDAQPPLAAQLAGPTTAAAAAADLIAAALSVQPHAAPAGGHNAAA